MSTTDPKIVAWLATIPTRPARLLESRAEMDGVRRLVVDVSGHPLRDTYTTPGQYVALGVRGGDRRFFAVASDPRGPGRVEFLIGAGQAVADALLALEPRADGGDDADDAADLDLSAALGDGYPLLPGEAYGVVGSGTGMASLRPAVDALIAQQNQVEVWAGGRPDGAFAFAEVMERWTQRGVSLHRTTGRVSDLLAGDLDAMRAATESSRAPGRWQWLVCGSDAMQEAARDALLGAGVPRERIHFNW